jgi:predicted NUDIX family NTP pyrophosphohydrolase
MAKLSAGLLVYRQREGGVEVFLVHPGGPFWQNKDTGAWSIPKGEFTSGEEPLAAARREFREETGFEPIGSFIPLEPRKQPSGKMVHAWAFEADLDPAALRSNMFQFEWPPKSGNWIEVPEIDRADWFSLNVARNKILPGQRGFLDQLEQIAPGPHAAT